MNIFNKSWALFFSLGLKVPRLGIIPLIMTAAFVTLTPLLIFAWPAQTSTPANPRLNHPLEAGSYPVDIQHLYTQKSVTSQSIYGFDYVKVYENWINTEVSCDFCTKVEYIPNPQNNSEFSIAGNIGHDFQDAKKITFFVMGQSGSEVLRFEAVGRNMTVGESHQVRYDIVTVPVHLSKTWKKIEIDLRGSNMTAITNPLGVQMEMSNGALPMVFYLKGVRYENTPSLDPIGIDVSESIHRYG